jgi:ABC-type phosphate/phosphonate transport system substrate-binding protein
MTRRTSLAAIALATILLAACSSTSSSTPSAAATTTTISASGSASVAGADAAAYADRLCTSIDQWQQSLSDGNQSLRDAITAGNPTPQDVKDALEAYMTSATQDTQAMLDDIDALSSPPGMEEATAAIETALTNAKTLLESVRSSVQSLDTTNPANMASALSDLVPQLQQGAQEVSDAINSVQSPELTSAIDSAPACDSLSSGTP